MFTISIAMQADIFCVMKYEHSFDVVNPNNLAR